MKLNDLISDKRTSLDKSIKSLIDQPAFRTAINQLRQYRFRTGTGKDPHLWDHQKAAIGTVVAYLNGDKSIPERPNHTEAALLKLPTGTGKSGIIAVIARCLPEEGEELLSNPLAFLLDALAGI